MTALIVTCPCGRDYEPTRAEIIAGYATWSRCPDCRPRAPDEAGQMQPNATTETGAATTARKDKAA